MWFLQVQSQLMRSWLEAIEASSTLYMDASREVARAWMSASVPMPATGVPFPFFTPFAHHAPAFAFNPWTWMSWQQPWLSPAWFGSAALPFGAPFPWSLWQQQQPMIQLLSHALPSAYRTAGGHVAAAILLQPQSYANPFGWPGNAFRGPLH